MKLLPQKNRWRKNKSLKRRPLLQKKVLQLSNKLFPRSDRLLYALMKKQTWQFLEIIFSSETPKSITVAVAIII